MDRSIRRKGEGCEGLKLKYIIKTVGWTFFALLQLLRYFRWAEWLPQRVGCALRYYHWKFLQEIRWPSPIGNMRRTAHQAWSCGANRIHLSDVWTDCLRAISQHFPSTCWAIPSGHPDVFMPMRWHGSCISYRMYCTSLNRYSRSLPPSSSSTNRPSCSTRSNRARNLPLASS